MNKQPFKDEKADNKVLEKAICMSYIVSEMSYIVSEIAISNLETASHGLNMIKDENAGKIQHSLEKLKNAHRKAFKVLENNIDKENLKELKENINELIGNIWD